MCFQGFVHFDCGHSDIKEAECDMAADIPFYSKVGCPNYIIERRQPRHACGMGKFYCKKTQEGKLFEAAHLAYIEATVKLKAVQSTIEEGNRRMNTFLQRADQAKIPLEARLMHSGHQKLQLGLQQLQQKLINVVEARKPSVIVVQAAHNYFRQCQKHTTVIRPTFTLPPDIVARLPQEWQEHMKLLQAHSSMSSAIGPVPVKGTSEGTENRDWQTIGDNIFVAAGKNIRVPKIPVDPFERPKDIDTAEPIFMPDTEDTTPVTTKKTQRQQRQTQLKNSTWRTKALPQPEKENERLTVRRSSRVREKKSYAESEGSSSRLSREQSPAKSDASNFMPSQSDRTESPKKSVSSKRRKASARQGASLGQGSNGNSLGDLIKDWQRRDSGNTAQSPPNLYQARGNVDRQDHSTMQANQSSPFRDAQPMRESSPSLAKSTECAWKAAALSTGTAKTIQGFETLGQLDFAPASFQQQGMTRQRAFSSFSSPPNMDQGWLFNGSAFQELPVTAMEQLHAQQQLQYGQAITSNGIPISNPANAIRANADYDRLRRSFSAIETLSPPVAAEPAPAGSHPPKRSLPLSPFPTSNKHIRLSLPGDEASSSIYDRNLPDGSEACVSSPSRMPSQLAHGSQRDAQQLQTENMDCVPASSPPVLMPTSVMYVPPLSHETSVETGDSPASCTTPQQDEVIVVEDNGSSPLSEIDWGLLNDDVL